MSERPAARFEKSAATNVAERLKRFSKSASLFSSQQNNLITKYPKQWVAVFDGKVVANAKTLDEVLAELLRQGVPKGEAMIRYLERQRRKFIL